MTYSGDPQERTWAMLCHLSALSGFIGIPFGHIVGPLIVWVIFRDRSAFVDDQGRESLNFQLSFTIYSLVLLMVSVIVGLLTCGLGLFVFIPAVIAFGIGELVLVIMASVAANNGEAYRYPYTIKFL